MRVPLSWLRELVSFDVPLPELRQRLTMAGLEVEEVDVVGADWRSVVIGRVEKLVPHPRRESLTVATISLGGPVVTVVTGATNLRVGDVVPHVAPGGHLRFGDVGERDFAGIASAGMVCSGDELDISPDRDSIYVLEPDAPLGAPLAEYLDEVVLDMYITANRPDCMAIMGVAREVHALFGAPYTPAMQALLDSTQWVVRGSPGASPTADVLRVRVEDSVGCPRFSAAVVQGIRIGPSPRWLQRRLHFAGVRPISNVVDVTNYVMLEVGQPLHAFDRSRLGSVDGLSSIVVRRAREGERLRTLDAEDRVLESEMLVVADEQRPRSLAGVMGGEDSEITDATSEVVLEGASWDRASIRRASGALNLWSEASRRFGRGVDPDLTALGVSRAVTLTLELAGGTALAGLVDEYPGRTPPATIAVRPSQIEALIGVEYSPQFVRDTLSGLGFAVEQRSSSSSSGAADRVTPVGGSSSAAATGSAQGGPRSGSSTAGAAASASGSMTSGAGSNAGAVTSGAGSSADAVTSSAGSSADADLLVTVPGWRRFDVEGRADLAEEVGRIAGFDRVPATMIHGAVPAPRPDGDAGFADELRARRTLAAAGLQEVITYSLVDPGSVSLLDGPSGTAEEALRVANPQSVEQSALRPSLLGSLLTALRANLRQRDRVLLFELARTWHGELQPLPDERRFVGIAMTGPRLARHWSIPSTAEESLDFFDLKGVVDTLCAAFRTDVRYAPAEHPHLHPGRSAALQIGHQRLGLLGQLHPRLAEQFDLDAAPVLVAELDFELLLLGREPLEMVQTPSRFPSAERDIAVVVDESVSHAEILAVIRDAAGSLLESAQLFDVYRGESIPAGRKSMAFALRYRAPDRTLDDDEVAGAHGNVERAVRERFGAEVRGR